jgi:4-hydroxy-3-methylbut-2-enyl diphosphate reductase
MKSFAIPEFYRSPLISAIKSKRKQQDPLKKDFIPTYLDLGDLKIYLARHFGFCYGVENAIEIAFRTVSENPGKRIFLLSEMIHNPQVNADLRKNGVQFIMNTLGEMHTKWDELNEEDIVIIPAFGTTLETEAKLRSIGIDPIQYNTTCPFVEKVWNRSAQIGKKGYTIIIHGKPNHEETRATFSHSSENTPSVVVKNLEEAKLLEKYITGLADPNSFYQEFKGQYSIGFDVRNDFERIGVVNQTTMLASDTEEITQYLRDVMSQKYQLDVSTIGTRFADTRDTLCYATNDNQSAVKYLLSKQADLAIVVGGYNSSNTSHLVELCEQKLPTFFIEDASKIVDRESICHYNLHTQQEEITHNYLAHQSTPTIMITSGASCPDAEVEKVILKLNSFFENRKELPQILQEVSEW